MGGCDAKIRDTLELPNYALLLEEDCAWQTKCGWR